MGQKDLSIIRKVPVKIIGRMLNMARARQLLALSVLCAVAAVGLALAGGCGLTGAVEATATTPSKPEGTLRVVTLNIGHGRGEAPNQTLVDDEKIASNLEATGDYLEELDADVVGLQEVDKNCEWSGNINQAKTIAAAAGLDEYRVGVNNRNDGWYRLVYGNAILSDYPIREYQNYAFSDASIGGKGYLVADIEMGERVVTFCVVHLDPVGSEDRGRQVERLVSTLKDRENPLVVMGDFNCEFGEEGVLEEMCSSLELETKREGEGTGNTFDFVRGRRIDYIFFSTSLDVSSYRLGASGLSDHRPVICDLKLETSR